jgi:hypothetical protein
MAEGPELPPQKQAIPRSPWNSPAQSAAVIGLIVVVAIIIGALYLAQATITATTGSELIALARTRDYLQRAISDTESKIALKKNINALKGRAYELGFRDAGPEEQDYIVVEGYSPIRATPTPQLSPVPTFVYDETFNGWVQQQWDALVAQFEQWMGRGQGTPTPVPR